MNSSTAIAIRDDQYTFDNLQKQALAHIGVETANPADLAVFFHTCKRTGLDPFARQIYMIRRDGKQTMQTGIDGLRLVAQRTVERTGETFGYEDTQWCGSDGQWVDVWLSSEPPAAARVAVLRNGQRFPGIALFTEYVGRKRDGDITKMWTDKAALMLAKCAEAAALRKAFPQDLSGIYSTEELARESAEPAPRLTAASFTETADPDADITDAEEITETPAADEWPNDLTESTRKRMFALFTKAGITDREEQIKGITRVIGRPIESRSELTEDEARAVCIDIETFIAMKGGEQA